MDSAVLMEDPNHLNFRSPFADADLGGPFDYHRCNLLK